MTRAFSKRSAGVVLVRDGLAFTCVSTQNLLSEHSWARVELSGRNFSASWLGGKPISPALECDCSAKHHLSDSEQVIDFFTRISNWSWNLERLRKGGRAEEVGEGEDEPADVDASLNMVGAICTSPN